MHVPLTEETRGLISKASIAKMKDGVILLNNARGQLVNEVDLVEALASGKSLPPVSMSFPLSRSRLTTRS